MCLWERGWGASSEPAGPLEPAHRVLEPPGEEAEALGGEGTGVRKQIAINHCFNLTSIQTRGVKHSSNAQKNTHTTMQISALLQKEEAGTWETINWVYL